VRIVPPLPENGFDDLEVFERQNAPDAAAVERQDPLWPGIGIEMLLFAERQWRLPHNLFHRVSRSREIWLLKSEPSVRRGTVRRQVQRDIARRDGSKADRIQLGQHDDA